MSSLYQINDQVDSIMAKIQSAFDESTGEIIDEELFAESQKELDNPRGERPLVELYLEPGVFSERCTEKLPLRVDFILNQSLQQRC